MIAKAEWTGGEANPRFLVTSLNWTDDARYLYEDLYCARGDMENRIKECQTDMFLSVKKEDILSLDLGLPDVQGLAAVRRSHSAAPRVPLVVLLL